MSNAQTVAKQEHTDQQERCIRTPRARQPQDDASKVVPRENAPRRDGLRPRKKDIRARPAAPSELPGAQPGRGQHSSGPTKPARPLSLSARTCFVLTSHCSGGTVQTGARALFTCIFFSTTQKVCFEDSGVELRVHRVDSQGSAAQVKQGCPSAAKRAFWGGRFGAGAFWSIR